MTYTDTNQIGEITEVTGNAKIIRTDGTEETITLGTEIYQGDIVETSGDSAVNIGFIDESSFAVSDDARIAIDEFVFDPETEGGTQDFSVIRGVFMYTSGLIGRENPDQVEIDTPVGSIGIRGTIIGGNINPEGISDVSVIEGAIVVRTNVGEQLLTNQYDTVSLTSINDAPSAVRAMSVNDMADKFGAVKDVSASLFSSFEDQMQQEQTVEEGVSEGLDSAEEAQAEAEEQIEEVSEEPVQDAAPEEGEQLLDAEPEIKSMDKGDAREAMQNRRAAAKEAREQNHNDQKQAANEKTSTLDPINDPTNQPTAPEPVAPKVVSFVSGGDIDETIAGGTPPSGFVLGTIGVTNVANASYAFVDPISGGAISTFTPIDSLGDAFTIDPTTGVVTFTSSEGLDFEDKPFHRLPIRVTDNDTGETYDRLARFDVNPINESPDVLIDLQDVYDVGILNDPSDDKGIIAIGEYGVTIGKLAINDPEGAAFSAGDITIMGNFPASATSLDTIFEISENGGDLFLKLQNGLKFIGTSASAIISDDGITPYLGLPPITAGQINFNLEITDPEGLSSIRPITLEIDNVANIIGAGFVSIYASDNIAIGDDANNRIIFDRIDDDFKFINGGDGYDLLHLSAQTGPHEYNFTGEVSGFNDDLSSIEQIFFTNSNIDDTLRIDIESVIRLLKTSNQNYEGNGELVISGHEAINTTGLETKNGFKLGADGVDSLENHGFVKDGTVDNRGANGEYHIFTHAEHGTVAIETSIVGADSGGL